MDGENPGDEDIKAPRTRARAAAAAAAAQAANVPSARSPDARALAKTPDPTGSAVRARRDSEAESDAARVIAFIHARVGFLIHGKGPNAVFEALADGQVLCRLVAALSGAPCEPTRCTPLGKHRQMLQNFTKFSDACLSIGVPVDYIARATDVSNRNVRKIIDCVLQLEARAAALPPRSARKPSAATRVRKGMTTPPRTPGRGGAGGGRPPGSASRTPRAIDWRALMSKQAGELANKSLPMTDASAAAPQSATKDRSVSAEGDAGATEAMSPARGLLDLVARSGTPHRGSAASPAGAAHPHERRESIDSESTLGSAAGSTSAAATAESKVLIGINNVVEMRAMQLKQENARLHRKVVEVMEKHKDFEKWDAQRQRLLDTQAALRASLAQREGELSSISKMLTSEKEGANANAADGDGEQVTFDAAAIISEISSLQDGKAAAERNAAETAATLTAELQRLRDELKDVNTRLEESQGECKRLAAQVAELEGERDALRATIDGSSATMEANTKEAADARRALGACRAAVRHSAGNALTVIGSVRQSCRRLAEDVRASMEANASDFEDLGAQLVSAVQRAADGEREAVDALQKETAERRRVHNLLQEAKGNIRVFCRVRPVLPHEAAKGAVSVAKVPSASQVVIEGLASGGAGGRGSKSHSSTAAKKFEYNHVFGPESTQEQVFEEVEPFVVSALDGYHASIFAYGQTGSGKTHTMMGSPDDWGVTLRTVHALFNKANSRSHTHTFSLSMSMLEIYNERVKDLLGDGDEPAKGLDIRHGKKGVYVDGLATRPVNCMGDVTELMRQGQSRRSVGRTDSNAQSSRSHSLVLLNVTSEDIATRRRALGKLVLVDLAGSERVNKSGVKGERLKEAQNINKSLSALGDVIGALTSKKSGHVPFRNSKLTHLLMDCKSPANVDERHYKSSFLDSRLAYTTLLRSPALSKDNKALMIVQVSPIEASRGETICSLNFAMRVGSVEQGKARRKGDDASAAEVAALKTALQKARAETSEQEELILSLQARAKETSDEVDTAMLEAASAKSAAKKAKTAEADALDKVARMDAELRRLRAANNTAAKAAELGAEAEKRVAVLEKKLAKSESSLEELKQQHAAEAAKLRQEVAAALAIAQEHRDAAANAEAAATKAKAKAAAVATATRLAAAAPSVAPASASSQAAAGSRRPPTPAVRASSSRSALSSPDHAPEDSPPASKRARATTVPAAATPSAKRIRGALSGAAASFAAEYGTGAGAGAGNGRGVAAAQATPMMTRRRRSSVAASSESSSSALDAPTGRTVESTTPELVAPGHRDAATPVGILKASERTRLPRRRSRASGDSENAGPRPSTAPAASGKAKKGVVFASPVGKRYQLPSKSSSHLETAARAAEAASEDAAPVAPAQYGSLRALRASKRSNTASTASLRSGKRAKALGSAARVRSAPARKSTAAARESSSSASDRRSSTGGWKF